MVHYYKLSDIPQYFKKFHCFTIKPFRLLLSVSGFQILVLCHMNANFFKFFELFSGDFGLASQYSILRHARGHLKADRTGTRILFSNMSSEFKHLAF